MKTVTRLSLLAASILVAGQAAATSIDFRAEHRHTTNDHKYRVKISDNIGNFNVGAEIKFKSDTDKFMSSLIQDGSEIDFGYTHRFDNSGWYLQPGMPVTFGSNNTTYKPQLRVGYRFDTAPTFLALRYRHEIRTYTGDLSDDQKAKLTFTTGWKFDMGLALNFEANYEQMTHNPNDRKLYDNGDTNYDYQVKIGYPIGQFTPYVDFTDIPVSSSSSERQLRSRVGVSYKF